MRFKIHTNKRVWLTTEPLTVEQAENKYLGKNFFFKEKEKVEKLEYCKAPSLLFPA